MRRCANIWYIKLYGYKRLKKPKKHGITHIVIDEEIEKQDVLEKVFNNYEQNKNIKKIFDSKEEGYNYDIKIYKIDYN